jgi:hypothetical protein
MNRFSSLGLNRRRAWGMLLVVVVLASGFFAAVGVSEHAIETYRLHKERADRRAMRSAARSALGLVASSPDRWLDSAFGASEATMGDFVARVSSAAMPAKYHLPSSDDLAYRLIRLEILPAPGGDSGEGLDRLASGRLANRSPATLKVERLYAAAYQAGQPLRLLFLEERFSAMAQTAPQGSPRP